MTEGLEGTRTNTIQPVRISCNPRGVSNEGDAIFTYRKLGLGDLVRQCIKRHGAKKHQQQGERPNDTHSVVEGELVGRLEPTPSESPSASSGVLSAVCWILSPVPTCCVSSFSSNFCPDHRRPVLGVEQPELFVALSPFFSASRNCQSLPHLDSVHSSTLTRCDASY